MAICPQCGAPVETGAKICKYCGEPIPQTESQQPNFNAQNPQFTQPPQMNYAGNPTAYYTGGIDVNWPVRNKIVAGILALLLGGIGIHKFYLGQIGWGIVYVLFCWTGIPALVGLIEGIVYLVTDDYKFQIKNHVRLDSTNIK